jgi:hypothetical protein
LKRVASVGGSVCSEFSSFIAAVMKLLHNHKHNCAMRAPIGQCLAPAFANQMLRNVFDCAPYAAMLHRRPIKVLKGMQYPHMFYRPFAGHM